MANSRIATSSITQGFPKSKSLLTGNDAIFAGSYESIATVNVGAGGQASIVFSSIPSTYTHLQVRVFARTNRADTLDYLQLQFNSDTGSNYAYHHMDGGGGAVGAFGLANHTNIRHIYLPGGNATSNVFGVFNIDIFDYASTNKTKVSRALGSLDANTSGNISFSSGLWNSTNAISTITLTPISGNSFVQNSHFALYGIK